MSGFTEPKLMQSNRDGGECALCGNEIVKGQPMWWFNHRAYCTDHTDAEVKTERPDVSPRQNTNPSPTGLPSPEFWKDEIVELNRNLDRIVSAIDNLADKMRR